MKTIHLVLFEEKKKNMFFWLGGFTFYDVEKDLKVSAVFFFIIILTLCIIFVFEYEYYNYIDIFMIK